MRDNKLLRIIYFGALFVVSEIRLYSSKPSTVPWIAIIFICFLVGILDCLRTVYKDYKTKKIGNNTYEEILYLIILTVITIITMVLLINKI